MCNIVRCICEKATNADIANWITAIVTCVATSIAVGALVIAYKQLRRINATDSSRFLLELRDAFSKKHRWKVHCSIKANDNGLKYLYNHTAELDDYLGLFEICEVMISKGTMTVRDFSIFYLYRLEYILENNYILNKLVTEKTSYWINFSKLFKRFPELKEEYYETPEQILFWEKIESE